MAFVELGKNAEKDLWAVGKSGRSKKELRKNMFDSDNNALYVCMKLSRSKYNKKNETP